MGVVVVCEMARGFACGMNMSMGKVSLRIGASLERVEVAREV